MDLLYSIFNPRTSVQVFVVPRDNLGVVDLARPGIGRRGDSRGGVASDIASNARVGLLKSAVVGRHLDGARPVAVYKQKSKKFTILRRN